MHAAVLGSPVAHSLSPLLHTAAYAALGLDDWRYHAVTCRPGDLPALLDRVRVGGWAGLSLTMPLKTVAIALLDEVVGDLGAVNTVVIDAGRLVGHNTDVDGVLAGLRELSAPVGRAAVLGAGGTARAALAALALSGAREVSLHVRDADRARPAVVVGERCGLAVTVAGLEHVPAGVTVVSTLPVAAQPGLTVRGPLLDVVYAPWPTPLARQARSAGQRVVGGRTVLVGQAAKQVLLLTGRRPPPGALAGVLARLDRPPASEAPLGRSGQER